MKQYLIISNKECGRTIEFPRRGTSFGINAGNLWVSHSGCLYRFSLEKYDWVVEER